MRALTLNFIAFTLSLLGCGAALMLIAFATSATLALIAIIGLVLLIGLGVWSLYGCCAALDDMQLHSVINAQKRY